MWNHMQQHTYDLVSRTQEFEIVEYVFTKFIHSYGIPHHVCSPIGVCGAMGLGGEWISE